jgi:hypothetical protein
MNTKAKRRRCCLALLRSDTTMFLLAKAVDKENQNKNKLCAQ